MLANYLLRSSKSLYESRYSFGIVRFREEEASNRLSAVFSSKDDR